MPKLSEKEMKELLAANAVTAISIDTSIFDEKHLQLNSTTLQALSGLKERPFDFILSGTVGQEVLAHLEDAATKSLNTARRGIGQALSAFDTHDPQRDALLEQITRGQSPQEAAKVRFNQYVADTGCVLLDDSALVDTTTLFEAYFGGQPPFGSGKKKSEFPDALALNALEQTALKRGAGVMVVSKDGDWVSFCEASDHLFLFSEIESALALIANAPPMLKKAVLNWAQGVEDGASDLRASLESAVEHLDFVANGMASSGECEMIAWAGTLKDLEWPDERYVDIIDYEIAEGDGTLNLTVNLPLSLTVRVPVEVNFSVWDGIDKEAISMGGRTIEVDEEIYTPAIANVKIHSPGTEDEEIEFVGVEFEENWFEVELGEIDVFEPEDYDWNDEATQES